MTKLTINNQSVEVPEGATILDAAKQLGVQIPTMCHLDGTEHFTSCMICLVKDRRNGRLMPSCSMPASEGMDIVTDDEECAESRKAALELLLSEHVGDCEAPCQSVCPAHMNIPLMNRLIARGDFEKALQVVKRDIALPAVLGRICPAPCEAGCRRKPVDQSVAICHLKQFVADEDLKQAESWMPQLAPSSGKKVAIVGAGPAGLATAYYLQLQGHQVHVFDQNSKAGGDLLKIEENILPASVLESEVAQIACTGIEFHFNTAINATEFQQLKTEYHAVVLATGASQMGELLGLKCSKQGIDANKITFQTSESKVFAVGNALRPSKLAVRSVGQGKELAAIIDNFLKTGIIATPKERFRSKFGKLEIPEFAEYLKESQQYERLSTSHDFSAEEARREAERCLHCDCRNPESCKLRIYADEYGAEQRRFQTSERRLVHKQIYREGVVYEAEKCIKCGICVRLTQKHQEEFGFTFVGRGFDVKIGIPFDESLQVALRQTAGMVASHCPTGALALYNSEEHLQKELCQNRKSYLREPTRRQLFY